MLKSMSRCATGANLFMIEGNSFLRNKTLKHPFEQICYMWYTLDRDIARLLEYGFPFGCSLRHA